jgi:hypothetical protein
MIVIEGRQGKSRVLENMIRNDIKNKNIIIIDTVGVNSLSMIDGVEYLRLESDVSVDQVVDLFIKFYDKKFKKFDWIVFEVNAHIEKVDLSTFKELDRMYSQNFIVTVQNDNREDIVVYFA